MKLAAVLALGLALAHSPALADTGFLDRTVTIGKATYRYQVYVPAEYSRDRAWPVVVDLHGNGVQGNDGLMPTVRGVAEQIRRSRARFPVIAVFPQAAERRLWLDGDMEELVMAELDRTLKEFRCDPARVYLAGFSMGATGAYRIAFRWPERFAAMFAVAGRVATSDAPAYPEDVQREDRAANPFVASADPFAALAAGLHRIPIRIVHGDADERVPVEHSRRLVAALKAAGAAVDYQEYAGAKHNEAAERAYSDEALFAWLFAQHR